MIGLSFSSEPIRACTRPLRPPRAIIGYPVLVGSKIVGALRWYYDFEFEPDKDHLTWKEYLAINVGLAIEKNQLLIQLKTRQDWYADILFEMDAKPYKI